MARINTIQLLLGKYRSPDDSMDVVKAIQSEGVKIYDVYSPCPIHGMDRLMGIKRSRLSVAAFMFGCLGLATALFIQLYMMFFDWPMDIGGKPFIGMSYVPVCFELTVLLTAFGMVFTFFAVSKLFPGKSPVLMDDRVTDDVIVVAIDRNQLGSKRATVEGLMKANGAFEIVEKDVVDEFFEV